LGIGLGCGVLDHDAKHTDFGSDPAARLDGRVLPAVLSPRDLLAYDAVKNR
jgi:hypothetical protein